MLQLLRRQHHFPAVSSAHIARHGGQYLNPAQCLPQAGTLAESLRSPHCCIGSATANSVHGRGQGIVWSCAHCHMYFAINQAP